MTISQFFHGLQLKQLFIILIGFIILKSLVFMEICKDSACGPIDRSLMFMQEDHISTTILVGGDRRMFDVRQYTTCVDEWVLDDQQRHLLHSWGFGVFADPRVVSQNDIALIRSLVE